VRGTVVRGQEEIGTDTDSVCVNAESGKNPEVKNRRHKKSSCFLRLTA
jgi:hypothetical protein